MASVPAAIEQQSARSVSVWVGRTPGGALLVLAPFYAEAERERFTRRHLAERLGLDAETVAKGGLDALWVVNPFAAPDPANGEAMPAPAPEHGVAVLGAGAPIIRAVAIDPSSGKRREYADRPLGQSREVQSDALLRALLMAGGKERVVPRGQAARILVWMPEIPIEEADEIRVALRDGSIPLRAGVVSLADWQIFKDGLDRDLLDRAFVVRPPGSHGRVLSDSRVALPDR